VQLLLPLAIVKLLEELLGHDSLGGPGREVPASDVVLELLDLQGEEGGEGKVA